MDPLTIGVMTTVLLLILILLGIHIAVALALMSILGIWLSIGDFNVSINVLSTTTFHSISEYIFSVIPLFVLMGLLSNMSGASRDLYNSFHVLLKAVRGGIGMATVIANAIFATITGVSVASAAVFSKISLPSMLDLKYDKKLALGTVAGSSVLGMLIPPSLLLIVYGMLAEISVGKLFIAGIIPGIILVLVYCIGIYTMATLKPHLVGGRDVKLDTTFNKEDLLKALIKTFPIITLVIVILGGIYVGFLTPTEAGAIGAFGALLLVIFRKKLNFKEFWMNLIETGYTTGSVLLLLISASMYSRMLSMTGIISYVNQFVNQLNVSTHMLIIVLFIILFVMGMVIDSTSILLISMPLMLPVVSAIGYDLITFGIIAVIVIEIGLLTPPFGLVAYSMKSALGDNADIGEIFTGSIPFIIMMMICVTILLIFPDLITWLPSVMQGE
ncbi:TRAP transporter large permease [Alteribacillus sp. JSM 102045]|uniref:TRAP transporter large permease n=1 Tax=Alteribacillus sp. JSM 102045 TaxID=1562101 RepID=UPI0035BED0EA